MVEFLSTAVEHGGVFAYLLIGLGVFALAVAIERFYVLNFRYSINGQGILEGDPHPRARRERRRRDQRSVTTRRCR